METRREDNPWKRKARVELIGWTDVVIALLGMGYSSYRMFTFYWNPKDQDASDIVKDSRHVPFYLFVWLVVVFLYCFQVGTAWVLYTAINQEAIESDPYISIQKCHCWLRCARVIMGIVVIKLCLQPVIILLGKFSNIYTIGFGLVELLFRSTAIFGVKSFIHDLQQ